MTNPWLDCSAGSDQPKVPEHTSSQSQHSTAQLTWCSFCLTSHPFWLKKCVVWESCSSSVSALSRVMVLPVCPPQAALDIFIASSNGHGRKGPSEPQLQGQMLGQTAGKGETSSDLTWLMITTISGIIIALQQLQWEQLKEIPIKMILGFSIWRICQGGGKFMFTCTPLPAEGWDRGDSPSLCCH